MSKETTADRFNILCLDGGGAKGFYTLGFLRELEAALGEPLHNHFHAIYGTSTGAIIASLIGLGKSAVETLKLYEDNVPSILGARGAGNKSAELKRVADALYGELQWSDFKTRIGIVATNWTRERPLIFKNMVDAAHGMKATFVPGFGCTVPELIRNKPFWHNYEIDTKDKKTGGLRKVIRLLKTLKYDAEPELKISSYDIAALAWNMSEPALTVQRDAYLPLATNARDELKRFIDNEALRNGLRVPNGTRLVFGAGGATIESLRQLHAELADLIQRIEIARIINFSKTATASARKPLPLWEERRPQVILEHSY